MTVTINGTTGVTTPQVTTVDVTSDSYTGPISVSAAAPNNSLNVDASGNVGVGTSSPSSYGKLTVDTSGTATPVFYGRSADQSASRIILENTGVGGQKWQIVAGDVNVSNSGLSFYDGTATRARIDSSGNLLVRTTSVPNVATGGTGFSVSATELVFSSNTNGGNSLSYWRTQSGNSYISSFWNGNSNVGNIAVTTTTTTYNTSSDYRLKNTIAPMTGALAKVAALKPVTYKWNADGSDGEGFIAHELQAVVPQCVTGEKDAVDADGNPVYQGIDTSFLVATLTAAIQEQQAIINSLTTRIAALEAK